METADPLPPALSELRASDGTVLALRRWPSPAAPRAIVLIVHGLGEHSGRYDGLARHLHAWGLEVHAYDQRGHGRSGGPRGAISSGEDPLADLGAVYDRVNATGPLPVVLLGQSMGGLIAARFVAEAWRPVQGLVMLSPALDPGLSRVQRALLAVGCALAPDLRVPNGLDRRRLSRDPQAVQAFVADPLVHDRVTPRLVRFIVESAACVQAAAARWTMPTLLLWAGDDAFVDPAGSERFARCAPARSVQAQRFDAMYHEMLTDPQRESVLTALREWFDAPPMPGPRTASPV